MRTVLVLIAGVLLAGCEYTVPLTTTPELAVDPAVVGLWRRTTDDGHSQDLLVLPMGPQEYLVSFPAGGEDSLFARACLVEVAGNVLVQLRWFGTARGGTAGNDAKVYQFAEYSVADDALTVRLLNRDVVGADSVSSAELARAIAANRDNPEIFRAAMAFTRAPDSAPRAPAQ